MGDRDETAGGRDAGRRVIVINDTEEILELFRDIIEPMGHTVIPLTYAPDDLAHIVEERPDLVIVDFVMGGQEFRGWQLVQKMKMKPETAGVPMIVCTGAKREVMEYEGWLAEKGVVVVLKPFDISDLERGIAKALRPPLNRAARERQAASGEATPRD